MRIAKRDYVEEAPLAKVVSKEDQTQLVIDIRTRLLQILGIDDSAEFDIEDLKNVFLVNQGRASREHVTGKDFMRAYKEVVADLTKNIVDIPAIIDEESGEVLKEAVTHRDYKIGETFYGSPAKKE